MFVLLSQVDISGSYRGHVDERDSGVNIAIEEEASCAFIAILDVSASSFGFVQLPSLLSILIIAHSSYLLRNWQVKMLLIERDVWGTVDGSYVMAVETMAWEKQAKALATICMLADDRQMLLVPHFVTTPNASWDTPQEQQSESFANELYVRRRFNWVTLPEGADVSVHSCFEDIACPWADIGARVTDREFILASLGSLLNCYSGLVTALESLQFKVKLPSQCVMHKEATCKDIHLTADSLSVRILRR